VVEHLPSKHKAMDTIPGTAKNNKQQEDTLLQYSGMDRFCLL
jgi:hypothetical protein